MTAEEFARRLAEDPAYQVRMRHQAARAEILARECTEDERSILTELWAAGVPVGSVWDLVAAGGASGAAIPILLTHLSQPHHPRIWEGIVRALSTRAAGDEALGPLSQLYRAETDPERRWLIANAIGSMARLAEARELEGIAEHRALFRQSRKPGHVPLSNRDDG